jgi:tetratricopeptide (TPR) repeat protein
MAAPAIFAQQPANNPQPDSQPPAQSPTTQGNPFPGDTTNVPVLPNSNSSAVPADATPAPASNFALPAQDSDPARSPDESDSSSPMPPGTESSSSVSDADRFQPKDEEDTHRKGKGKETPEFHETAAGDIDVGNYELQRKNWKGALSRFQSAMVLNPENPDAFWGMAEAARHLGDFASARSYYQKVFDYDPDSKHGKEARKALKDPEIANAQAAKTTPATQK